MYEPHGFRPLKRKFCLRPNILAFSLITACLCAAQAPSGTAKQNSSAPPSASGFSIETEMLTYRALESNSEAIACDVESVISGAKPDFSHPADGAACAPLANAPQTTIVLLPFEKSELEDFAAWRAAMADLAELQSKAASLGCPKSPTAVATPRTGTLTSSLSSFISASPVGPPLALGLGVLGLFESEEATTTVSGNIQDLAFVNNVARQLKALHIFVVTPSSYDPGNLTAADETASPFLASTRRTLLAQGCLSTLKPENDQNSADIKQAISDIKDYMAALASNKPAKTANDRSASNDASGGSGGSGGTRSSTGSTGLNAKDSTNPTAGTLANPPSALSVILRADGLAQKLGFRFNAETGKLSKPATGHYILMVKALESGGSVTGTSNTLGTRLRYSGGAVGTYALFAADGNLACSGNVYDYGGSLPAKHFERNLRNVHFDPSRQVIFHTGGCSSSGAVSPSVPASNPIQ
jgi:hypothetical protein